MDKVTRCLHCGKRLVPVPSADGRTELQCVWCDKLDPMEIDGGEQMGGQSIRHTYFRGSPRDSL